MSRDDQPISSEDEIIRDFLRPLAKDCDAALELKDDAACLTPPPGMDLVITKDTLVAGVHFFPDDPPRSIGLKAAAVNVSDLVAKGARPTAYFLSLAFPSEVTRGWVADFTEGLGMHVHGLLAGGDLVATPGPLTISVTAIGAVPAGKMVRRTTARPGDHVYVTGFLGGSNAGLSILSQPDRQEHLKLVPEHRERLISAYRVPEPPDAFDETLRNFASASMDLSDGLVKDASRMCEGSGVGMTLDGTLVPIEEAVRASMATGAFALADVLSGGDDYQVLFTVPDKRHDTFLDAINILNAPHVTRIGQVTDTPGELIVRDADGKSMMFEKTGHDHF